MLSQVFSRLIATKDNEWNLSETLTSRTRTFPLLQSVYMFNQMTGIIIILNNLSSLTTFACILQRLYDREVACPMQRSPPNVVFTIQIYLTIMPAPSERSAHTNVL